MSQTALTVGTAYADRLMTGTGTVSDPWVIGGDAGDTHDNMLQNLLDAVSTGSAYIKLVRDIDAAQSVTYRAGISHAIIMRCAQLDADSETAVSNLIVTAANAIFIDTVTVKITNLRFANLVHEGTDPTVTTTVNWGTSKLYLTSCDFSTFKKCSAGSAQFSAGNVYASDRCSFWHKAIDVGTKSNLFAGMSFDMCQIHYIGPLYMGSSNVLLVNATTTGFTGDFTVRNGTDASAYVFNYCNGCYFAGNFANDVQDVALGVANGTDQNLICINNSGVYAVSADTASISSKGLVEVTSDQLKSRDYLYSIGFLP